jgi:hypothetical protein
VFDVPPDISQLSRLRRAPTYIGSAAHPFQDRKLTASDVLEEIKAVAPRRLVGMLFNPARILELLPAEA